MNSYVYTVWIGKHVVTDAFLGVWLNREDLENYLRLHLPTVKDTRFRIVFCRPNEELHSEFDKTIIVRTERDLPYIPIG